MEGPISPDPIITMRPVAPSPNGFMQRV
jgi:hypothetical protein